MSHAHADFILELVRTLRNPELKVVKFVPKQFRARNRTLENEAFILRKHTVPPFMTKIDYIEDDLVLTKCLLSQHTFVPHLPDDLPLINLGPQRPLAPGCRKRTRSDEHISPNPVEKKKDRALSPQKQVDEAPDHNLSNDTTDAAPATDNLKDHLN